MKKNLLLVIILAGCAHVFAQIPTANLKARYLFNGTLADSSGFAGNFTNSSGSTTAPAYATDRFGQAGKCIDRTISGSYEANGPSGGTDLTVGAWVNLQSYAGSFDVFGTVVSDLVYVYDPTGYLNFLGGYTLRIDNNGKPNVALVGQHPTVPGTYIFTDIIGTPSDTIPLNQWHHIAFSYNRSNFHLTLYLDGDSVAGATNAIDAQGFSTYYLGCRREVDQTTTPMYIGPRQILAGKIDDLVMYDRELTACEIKILAEQVPTPDVTITATTTTLEVDFDAQNSYQWYSCSNNQPVAGANTNVYSPTDNNDYYVIVTSPCVSDTSGCENLQISTVGIENESDVLSIYPVPATTLLQINTSANESHFEWITIYDMTGKVVNQLRYTNTINIEALAPGMYIIKADGNQMSGSARFIKQ